MQQLSINFFDHSSDKTNLQDISSVQWPEKPHRSMLLKSIAQCDT